MGFSQSRIAYISSTSGDSPAHGNLHPRGPLNGGRYNVLGMLGRGATSTVWLVHDESSPRLVAIKLVAASPSGENHEREIRQLLANAAPRSHAGYKYVQHMSDSFEEHGWLYHHLCLVGAPAGAFSLSSSKEASCGVGLFPLEVSRAMAAQLILAVGFLHSQGIVHGDIHLGNILVALPPRPMQAYSSRSALSAWFSSILSAGIGSTSPAVPSLDDYFDIPSHELTLHDAHILLTDFGEAWQPASSEKFALRTPYIARAPEAYFASNEAPLGAGADVWALACALFAIYAQRTLFEFIVSVDAAAALGEAVSALGPMPAAWLEPWTGVPIVPLEVFPLARRVQEVCTDRQEYARWFANDEPKVDDDELADIGDMLAAMLKWDPSDRVPAARVAEGQWMSRWGIPAMDRVEKAVETSENSS